MAKSARKTRKKHSGLARLRRTAPILTRDLYVVMVNGVGCVLYSKRVKGFVRSSPVLVESMCNVPYNWGITCAVFMRDRAGNNYAKEEFVKFAKPYLQSSLVDYATDMHNSLVESRNVLDTFINVGWIASPTGDMPPKSESDRIFSELEAWSAQYKVDDLDCIVGGCGHEIRINER